jgi:hypothetical protein
MTPDTREARRDALFGLFRERGWSIHMDDTGTQPLDPFDDLAAWLSESPALAQAAPPPEDPQMAWVKGFNAGREQGRDEAAAEAAPLDVERLARVAEKVMGGWYGDSWVYHRNLFAEIAREYAALRSPDTETAG